MGNKIFKSNTYKVQEETYKNCDLLKTAEINYSPIYTPREETTDIPKNTETQSELPTEYFKPRE